MTLMRVRCLDCKEIFSQEHAGRKYCMVCRPPTHRARTVIKLLRQRVRELEAVIGDETRLQRWFIQQFEPFLGDPDLTPLINKLLGRKTKNEAA